MTLSVPLWSVARPVRETVEPTSLGAEVLHYSIPVLEATGGPQVEATDTIKSQKLRLRGGELLISKLNPRKSRVLVIPQVTQPTVASTEFVAFSPYAADPRFLAYVMLAESTRQLLDANVRSVTRSHQRVEPEIVARTPIPDIPLDEQRRIADFLDTETARLDDAVTVREGQAALELERWRSLVAHAVLGLDGVPTPLKRLFSSSFAGVWGTEPGTDLADVLCARVADFDRENYRVVDVPTVRSVSLLDARRKALRAGDILLEKSGGTHAKPVGCAVMYEGAPGAVCSNFVQVLRPQAGVAPRFAGYVMAALYETRANGAYVHQTTGIQNLDMASYLTTTVALPEAEAQYAAVTALDREREHVAVVREALGRGTRLLTERRQALITAAVTGQLDVTTAGRGR